MACEWHGCNQPRATYYVPEIGSIEESEYCYYHSKVSAGLAQPLDTILTPREIEATMRGRGHGDGRRLDHYAIDDPIGET